MLRIRDRETFVRLRRSRVRARAGSVAVIRATLPTQVDEPAVAFSVGRKVGGAVVRNRIRRQLRASMGDLGLPPAAYLVTVTPGGGDVPPSQLRVDLVAALAALPPVDPAP